MSRHLLLSVMTATLLALPSNSTAQQAEPDSTLYVRALTAALKSDLRHLAMVQEDYFAEHGEYAGSPRDISDSFTVSPGVTVVQLTASPTGHSEIAIHERVPGLVCSMHLGDSPAPLGRGEPGRVICQGP